MRLQHIGEEMVIAIPLALIVERNDEEIAALQSFQHRFAILLPGDGITQRAAQPIENRGLQQETADTFGLALQDFFHQIVQHKAMAAGEGLNEAGGVDRPCMESAANCSPAIQPSVRASSAAMSGRQVEAHRLVEKVGGFVGGEAQIGGAQFG